MAEGDVAEGDVVDVVDLFQKLEVTSQQNQQRPPAPQELEIGKKMGKWTTYNNCWSFVDDVLKKCSNKCLYSK